tara:strand:- start:325 stop:651 length:327 start_codon:yes stop_codon:yes gene_type:complete
MTTSYHGEELTISMEDAMNKVRDTRNWMLEVFVDFYQSKPLLWAGLTETQKQELIDYREALLDWPERLQEIYGDVPPNSYSRYQPQQPSWFVNHPRGRMFPNPPEEVE